MTGRTPDLLRALVVLGSSAAALTSVVLELGVPWQPATVSVFVLVCPGLSLTGLLSVGSRLLEAVLSVAISIALAVVVSELLLYAGRWSPIAGLGVLVTIAVTGSAVSVLLTLLRPRRVAGDTEAVR